MSQTTACIVSVAAVLRITLTLYLLALCVYTRVY